MDKFRREYTLIVQAVGGETITIKLPFTVEFDVTRANWSAANYANIRIYNLNEDTRNKIRKDQYSQNLKPEDVRLVSLLVGYGTGNQSLMMKGTITQAWSVRQGSSFVTEIVAQDLGFAYSNAQTNGGQGQFASGTLDRVVIKTLVESLKNYGVDAGAIGQFEGQSTRGNSYSGSTTYLLQTLTGKAFFIDNGKAHVLKDNEALDVPVVTISSQNGLLNTPIRSLQTVTFEMILEPRLLIGQPIKIVNVTGGSFDNFYKVTGLHHKGTISDAICGSATTSVTCLVSQTPFLTIGIGT